MKNRIISLAVALLLCGQFVKAKEFPEHHKTDTIEVHFGDQGTILIQVDSKEDLEALKNYDLNMMLQDIEVPTQEELGDTAIYGGPYFPKKS